MMTDKQKTESKQYLIDCLTQINNSLEDFREHLDSLNEYHNAGFNTAMYKDVVFDPIRHLVNGSDITSLQWIIDLHDTLVNPEYTDE